MSLDFMLQICVSFSKLGTAKLNVDVVPARPSSMLCNPFTDVIHNAVLVRNHDTACEHIDDPLTQVR